MEKNIQIKEIFKIFQHSGKKYTLFSTTHSDFTYLYYSEFNKHNRTLLYGNNLLPLTLKYIKNKKTHCLECNLGQEILGAITLDEGDLIASKISKKEANIILKALKNELKKPNFIRYF